MIKQNKTIAKIMILALWTNTMPVVNAFAINNSAGNNIEVVEEEIAPADVSNFKFDSATKTITWYKGTGFYTGKNGTLVIPQEIDCFKVKK